MAKQYKLRRAIGVAAEVIGNEFERICGKHGSLTPALVVEAARPKKAPLHNAGFTWDNTAAAEKCRIIEARNLIRAVHVVDDDTGEDRGCAYANVVIEEEEEPARRVYLPVAEVVQAPELLSSAIGALAAKQAEATQALEDLINEANRLGKRKQAAGLKRAHKATHTAAQELSALV